MDYKGKHITADVKLRTPIPANIIDIIYEGIELSKMNVVSESRKRFTPEGDTLVLILSESHFTLHTYPEHRYLSMDCYTCGEEGDPEAAMRHIIGRLDVAEYNIKKLPRGEFAASG